MSDYAIDEGHNCKPDIGATGIIQEDVVTKAVAKAVISKLENLKYSVTVCLPPTANTVNDSLYYRYTVANRDNAKHFVSIHANIGGGEGTEVWCGGSAASKTMAQNVLSQITALGYKNRGVKVQGIDGQHLAVLNRTNMPAILVELFFLDCKSDCGRYNADLLATAIVQGLTGKKIVQTVNKTVPVNNAPHYDVTTPEGSNIFKIPDGNHYIESLPDRLLIHLDRGNYIDIRKGSIYGFVNDNNGNAKSERLL